MPLSIILNKRTKEGFVKQEWEYYTITDAINNNIPFKYWRDKTLQVGEFALTDDSYVLPVTHMCKGIVRTILCTAYNDKAGNNQLFADSISRSNLNANLDFKCKNEGLSLKQQSFVINVASYFDPIKAVEDVYPADATNKHHAKRKAKKLMNNSKIQEYYTLVCTICYE